MREYGFTLVELIITIAIMGIILLVAFPSVTRLQQNNKYEKIVSYGQSMVSAGKLYVDQYQEDLWGSMTATGTKNISMTTLQSANLMKEIHDKKTICSSGNLRISRTGSKNNFNYTYQYTLSCTISGQMVSCEGDQNTSRCTQNGKVVYNSAT